MGDKTISGKHNGFDFVEIGGIKWATCNVGAEKPTDAGLYFQWGDRKGYTADEVGKTKRFYRNDYKHYNGRRLTKYTEFDRKHVLDLCDDAAFAYMCYGWRMPTCEDFRSLFESTAQMRTEDYCNSGIAGTVFTDRTDATKELFFPAVGFCVGNEVLYVGQIGSYWSSSLLSTGVFVSCCLFFHDGIVNWDSNGYRYQAFPVRGVLTV